MIRPPILRLLPLMALQACTSLAGNEKPQENFDAYRQQTLALIRAQRDFQTDDHAAELDWNAPREWRPTGTPRGGILLVQDRKSVV